MLFLDTNCDISDWYAKFPLYTIYKEVFLVFDFLPIDMLDKRKWENHHILPSVINFLMTV